VVRRRKLNASRIGKCHDGGKGGELSGLTAEQLVDLKGNKVRFETSAVGWD
jgi:hypothetical protein